MDSSLHTPHKLRASTTVHLASTGHLAPGPATGALGAAARLSQLRLLDEVLDLAESEPAFRQFTITGGAAALESYVSLRPEHYERVERAVQNHRLLVGPWYVDPQPPFPDPEISLRNLHLGMWTCRIFGRSASTVYLPGVAASALPAYLPQLLRGFGIEGLILDAAEGVPLEGHLTGDDGTHMMFGSALHLPAGGDLSTLRGRYGQSPSRSALVVRPWLAVDGRAERLAFVQRLNSLSGLAQDEILHSSPEAYAWTLRWLANSPTPPPEVPLSGSVSLPEAVARAARLLVEVAEPLTARAEATPPTPDESFVRRPQAILRRAWQSLLQALALTEHDAAESGRLLDEAESLARALVESLGGDDAPGAAFGSVVSASVGFRILAAKLPDDPAGRGLIVRGVNPGDVPVMVTLRPWRRFATARVVGLDETPTGGTLSVDSEGSIHFRAAPHRYVSFWFDDGPGVA